VRSFFMDASGLAKRYVPELGTSLINHLFASLPPDRLLVFNISVAEVVSVLVRRRNAGLLSGAGYWQSLTDFSAEVVNAPNIVKVTADDALVTAALPLIEAHSVNATDAIILRSALDFASLVRARGDDLVVVASDLRLVRAAQAEGLQTFNRDTQSQAELDALLAP